MARLGGLVERAQAFASFTAIVMGAPTDRLDKAKSIVQHHVEQGKRRRLREGDPDPEKLGVLLTAMIDFAPTPEGQDRVAQSVIDCKRWRDLVQLYEHYQTFVFSPSELSLVAINASRDLT
jgi:hypothetical protein